MLVVCQEDLSVCRRSFCRSSNQLIAIPLGVEPTTSRS